MININKTIELFGLYEEEISKLKQQLAEAQTYKTNAERYRLLRDNGCIFWTGVHTDNEVKHQVCEQAMDKVIDKILEEIKL